MKLGIHDGKLCWLKKDGSPSAVQVNTIRGIEYYKFPIPCGPGGGGCTNLSVWAGNPRKDRRLIVRAGGNTWFGTYLVDRDGEVTKLAHNTSDLLEAGTMTLENAESFPYKDWRERRFEAAEEVDPRKLARKKGLKVKREWAYQIDQSLYWISGKKQYVTGFPPGWVLVEKGDAVLTRGLCRDYPHWIVTEANSFDALERVGIVVSQTAVRRVYDALGGDAARAVREEKKQHGLAKLTNRITEKLRTTIRKQFPRLPAEDLDGIVSMARATGRVGNAAFLHFGTNEERERGFSAAAQLAVRAHARHQYTDYDGLFHRGYNKEMARQSVADAVTNQLSEWM